MIVQNWCVMSVPYAENKAPSRQWSIVKNGVTYAIGSMEECMAICARLRTRVRRVHTNERPSEFVRNENG